MCWEAELPRASPQPRGEVTAEGPGSWQRQGGPIPVGVGRTAKPWASRLRGDRSCRGRLSHAAPLPELHITPGSQESAERLSLSPSPGLGLDGVPWLDEGPAPTTRPGWGRGREHLRPNSCNPTAETPPPRATKSLEVEGRAWALACHSQLRDVLGDPLGQGLEVLVAAADDGVKASALLWALGPGDAAGLLLTCAGHREPQSHQGPAFGHRVKLDSAPCARLGLPPSHADHLPSPPKLGASGSLHAGDSPSLAESQRCRNRSCAQKLPCPTRMDATSQLQAALIFTIFKQEFRPRNSREEGTGEGAQPCKCS